MADEDLMLDVGGESVSLADIAGVDMDDVAEVRGSTFPGGTFQFVTEDAKLTVVGSKDDRKPGIQFVFKCTDVFSLTDSAKDANSVIGKKHNELCFLTEPLEGLGRAKAFMADVGYKGTGRLDAILDGFKGHEFKAQIKQRVDRNDKDLIYANIGLNIGRWKAVPVDGNLEQKAA